MEVTLGVCADYANVTREGKLNIMGIFEQIFAREFPAMHHEMQLVLRLEAQFTERDRPQRVEVRFHEPDGPTLFELHAEVAPRGGRPGEVIGMNQIIRIDNLPLPKPGVYQFAVFVNEDLKRSIPLRATLSEGGQQLQLPHG